MKYICFRLIFISSPSKLKVMWKSRSRCVYMWGEREGEKEEGRGRERREGEKEGEREGERRREREREGENVVHISV